MSFGVFLALSLALFWAIACYPPVTKPMWHAISLTWQDEAIGHGKGMVSKPQQLHRSFMLRLWRAGNGHAPEWRYSLEDVRTHERHGFTDLASLVAFLEGQIGDSARPQQIIEPRDTNVD